MAWTTPRTWVTDEVLTAALLNTHLRDNLNWLKTRVDTLSTRVISLMLYDDNTSLIIGDGFANVTYKIPQELNGWNLSDAHVCVDTPSTSGTPTFQVHNETDGVDMLSTAITIDANEKTSYTAATQPVVDTDNDDVATGDEIRVDCDVIGTGTKGCLIHLSFDL